MELIGYGNPGRQDDGLGPAFAARIAARNLPGITVSTSYQLTVDHALKIADATEVVFVDALMRSETPFRFAQIAAAASPELSSHSLTPGSVLALAATLYGAQPRAHVLGISGQAFSEVGEGLSAAAEKNLGLAEAFFLEWFEDADRAEERARRAHA